MISLWLTLAFVAGLPLGCGSHQPPIAPRPASPLPFVATPQRVVLDGEEVRIPFDLMSWIPVVKFTAADGTSRRLAIDTGASGSVFTSELAAACKATMRPAPAGSSYRDAGGSGTITEIYRVNGIRLGGARFEEFDASLLKILPAFDGLLGWTMFRDTLLTIDYPHDQLVLKHGSLPNPDGQKILPLKADGGQLFVKATLAGQELWLNIDTGAAGFDEIQITAARGHLIPWSTPPTVVQSGMGAGHPTIEKVGRVNGDLILGQYRLTQMVAGVNDAASCDILGALVLSQFTVTLDLRNMRAEFDRSTDQPIAFQFQFFDFGFRYNSQTDPLRVQEVITGSEAARAGLRRGDILLSVDGRPAREGISAHTPSDPFTAEIQRDNHRFKLVIPMTKYVP